MSQAASNSSNIKKSREARQDIKGRGLTKMIAPHKRKRFLRLPLAQRTKLNLTTTNQKASRKAVARQIAYIRRRQQRQARNTRSTRNSGRGRGGRQARSSPTNIDSQHNAGSQHVEGAYVEGNYVEGNYAGGNYAGGNYISHNGQVAIGANSVAGESVTVNSNTNDYRTTNNFESDEWVNTHDQDDDGDDIMRDGN